MDGVLRLETRLSLLVGFREEALYGIYLTDAAVVVFVFFFECESIL